MRHWQKNGMVDSENGPRRAGMEVYWGEIGPVDHAVQIYADQTLFMDTLEGFASAGLRAGDGVIVIATTAHRIALERRLRIRGFDVDLARREDRYTAVNAIAALSEFMIDGEPNEVQFICLATHLIARAHGSGRRVRVFGELVALLWGQRNIAATVALECLWNKLQAEETFCLFCAYPRSGFTQNTINSLHEICSHHSRQIPE